MPLELQYMTRGSFKVVVETSIELEWGQILSSSNVQAGPFLSTMCGRLLSRYSLGSTLIAVGVRSLFAVGRLVSSCRLQPPLSLSQGNSSLAVLVGILSRCGRVLFSN